MILLICYQIVIGPLFKCLHKFVQQSKNRIIMRVNAQTNANNNNDNDNNCLYNERILSAWMECMNSSIYIKLIAN